MAYNELQMVYYYYQLTIFIHTGKVENPEICSSLTSLLEVDLPYPATLSKYALKPDVANSIRSYQWELAFPGLSGQNYIICAPTGTGKTHVAGLIISEPFLL